MQDSKKFPQTHKECGCKREDFIESLNYIPREEYRIEKEELEKIVQEITNMEISCDTSLCNTCDIGCFD